MSNISTPAIIIAIFVILGIAFFIYLKTNGTVKKAVVPLLILILTTALGILSDEAIRRTNSVPGTSGTVIEDETGKSNTDVLNNKPHNDLYTNDTDAVSITDLIPFLLPTNWEFVKNRDKTYYPDWILILLSLLGGSYLTLEPVFYVYKHKSKQISIGKILLYLIVGLIFSFLNSYAIFIIASLDLKSGNSFLNILFVVAKYLVMLALFIGLIDWKSDILNE